jgi:predicted DNA-binding WGR domain protein
VSVAYYLSDGSTARARYPFDGQSDAVEEVETLIREKRRTGFGLAVDSLDSDQGVTAERFISPAHVVAWVVSAAGV